MLSEHEFRPVRRQELETHVPPSVSASQRSSAKNRGRLDTVAEILDSCIGGANKSRIMLKANVNSVVVTLLLERLVSSGLVVPSREDGHFVKYHPTQDGLQFVRKYSELISMLCPELMPPIRLNEPNRGIEAWV